MQRCRDFLDRTLILWLTLSCGLALYAGQTSPPAREYIAYWYATTMTPCIIAAMFCIGFLLPREEFLQVLRAGKSVLGGCATQYLCMPLLAFGIAKLLQLEGPLFTGMILTGAVPGAMASNVLTMISRGNVSYSISLTTMATLLSPLTVPLALYLLLGVRQGPEPVAVFLNLLQTVAAPVLIGFAFKCWLKKEPALLQTLAALVANVAILWVIAIAIGVNAERLRQVTGLMLSALLLLNVCGYLAGALASRLMNLDFRKQRALVLEIGMQNAGVGTMLAQKFFEDSATAIPPAVYTFGCMFTGTLLANYWCWRTLKQQAGISSDIVVK